MTAPYYADDSVTLWHGDMRDILPRLTARVDAIVADPPYGETSLTWDRWPDGWPTTAAAVASSMWCFGSMRMFLERRGEFDAWKLSQDIIWRKPSGTAFAADRFVRIHEHALHWYRGAWGDIQHQTPRDIIGIKKRSGATQGRKDQVFHGTVKNKGTWTDDGTRLALSVLEARNLRGRGNHPTEKPIAILAPLIEYVCPPGGIVLDPFAGSGSTAMTARLSGRRAVLIEADERYCETIVRRLAQDILPIGATS